MPWSIRVSCAANNNRFAVPLGAWAIECKRISGCLVPRPDAVALALTRCSPHAKQKSAFGRRPKLCNFRFLRTADVRAWRSQRPLSALHVRCRTCDHLWRGRSERAGISHDVSPDKRQPMPPANLQAQHLTRWVGASPPFRRQVWQGGSPPGHLTPPLGQVPLTPQKSIP